MMPTEACTIRFIEAMTKNDDRANIWKTLAAAASVALVLLIAEIPAGRAEIRIAVAGPVTGQLAGLGEHMLRGAREAVADINARGGLLGQMLALAIEDDQCDPKQAVAVANRIAASGAAMVAGHFCSNASIAAARIYSEEGVLMISPASTSEALTEAGHSLVFRVCGRDDQQGALAAHHIAKAYAGKRIAVIDDKGAYGRGLALRVIATLEALGRPPALVESFTPGERDYRALAAKLKQARIDVVFIGAYHTEAGLILRQMREQGASADVVGGDALVVSEFAAIAGPAADGVTFTSAADPRLTAAAAAIVERFRRRGIEPDGYVLYTYAAIEAWAEAVRRAASPDPAKVAERLRQGRFVTVIGDIGFDAKGDVDRPGFALFRWRSGTYAPLPAGH